MMKENNQLVSIIMPSFNSSETISESIDSILSQTYPNWELIVVDDCSTDTTHEVLNKYKAKDPRISFEVLTNNQGAGKARNRAIEQAKGRFIAFLDSDDLWLPNKLKIQLEFMKKENVALSYTSYQKFSKKGDCGIVHPPLKTTYKKLLYSNIMGCLTVIYDTHLVGKKYMPLIRKRQDMALWLDILKSCGEARGLPNVLAKYRVDTGMSSNKHSVLKYQWVFYRHIIGLTKIQSSKYFLVYALKGTLKHFKK